MDEVAFCADSDLLNDSSCGGSGLGGTTVQQATMTEVEMVRSARRWRSGSTATSLVDLDELDGSELSDVELELNDDVGQCGCSWSFSVATPPGPSPPPSPVPVDATGRLFVVLLLGTEPDTVLLAGYHSSVWPGEAQGEHLVYKPPFDFLEGRSVPDAMRQIWVEQVGDTKLELLGSKDGTGEDVVAVVEVVEGDTYVIVPHVRMSAGEAQGVLLQTVLNRHHGVMTVVPTLIQWPCGRSLEGDGSGVHEAQQRAPCPVIFSDGTQSQRTINCTQ